MVDVDVDDVGKKEDEGMNAMMDYDDGEEEGIRSEEEGIFIKKMMQQF